ncbi:type 1 glutamine amidotransferase [Leisingera sp. F5]|uniref:type 1 glutamine amidotransferase n=1 Tax=Leisingera sp. F5 TaxID=1813816 RepID=UPI000B2448D3|nr:type 1 glutamine amidotransferase [Leisingera sp. F5]
MRFLVFQHLNCEHPGSFRGMMREAGIDWTTIELDQDQPIPDREQLAAFDALWVMGGPMDVWDVAEHPWLAAEKQAIRFWVQELQKPYLGLCLGHQLLADALGGTCGPLRPTADVGVTQVELTPSGLMDPLLKSLPNSLPVLQWHGVEVAQPPESATVLASSPKCAVEAMRINSNAWSMQFHIEAEADTIRNWHAIPAYRNALVAALGEDGVDRFQSRFDTIQGAMHENARQVFTNFLDTVQPG